MRSATLVPALVALTLASPLAQAPPPFAQQQISRTGKCGQNLPAGSNITCVGSVFGDCCSNDGFCGRGIQYCGEGLCQAGLCAKDPRPGAIYTKDGRCGVQAGGALCGDGQWGPCCSSFGFCGRGDKHCGVGVCQSGACSTVGPLSGSPSLDGTCGAINGLVCAGTTFGKCCSNYGFCGDGPLYCGATTCFSGACAGNNSTTAPDPSAGNPAAPPLGPSSPVPAPPEDPNSPFTKPPPSAPPQPPKDGTTNAPPPPAPAPPQPQDSVSTTFPPTPPQPKDGVSTTFPPAPAGPQPVPNPFFIAPKPAAAAPQPQPQPQPPKGNPPPAWVPTGPVDPAGAWKPAGPSVPGGGWIEAEPS